MEDIYSQFYLTKLLGQKYDSKKTINIGPLITLLSEQLEISESQAGQIIYKCPLLLSFNTTSIKNNLIKYKKFVDIRLKEFKYLIFKFPFILITNAEQIEYQLLLIKNVFGVSMLNAFKLAYINVELLSLTKEQIITQIKMLSSKFNCYGIALRKMFNECPKLLTITKKEIEEMSSILMHNFTLSQDQVNKVFISCPTILNFSLSKLLNLYDFYYQTFFIKRDFKEMISNCPQFLLLSPAEFLVKIEQIQNVFQINQKKACEIIRTNPNILFFSSVESKVNGFKKLFVSLEYIKRNLSLLFNAEISIPLKYVLVRILGLESYFGEICEMNTNLFLSRFLFMQSYGQFEHKDLILSPEKFEEKYKISSRLLTVSYNLDNQIIENICHYYVSNANKIPNWKDIVFPNYEQILLFNNSELIKEIKIFDYARYKELFNLTNKEYRLLTNLKQLHLQENECLLIINKCKLLKVYENNNVIKFVEYLKKNQFTIEQIIKLLITKTSLVKYNINDFVFLVKEIMQEENCSIEQAIEKMA